MLENNVFQMHMCVCVFKHILSVEMSPEQKGLDLERHHFIERSLARNRTTKTSLIHLESLRQPIQLRLNLLLVFDNKGLCDNEIMDISFFKLHHSKHIVVPKAQGSDRGFIPRFCHVYRDIARWVRSITV